MRENPMRVTLEIGEQDMESRINPEAEYGITFLTSKPFANAIYTMVRAFKNK